MSVTFLTNRDRDDINESIVQLSEEIAAIIESSKVEVPFEKAGDFVQFRPIKDSALHVVSEFSEQNEFMPNLTLHQVNSANVHDIMARFGGAGTVFEKDGITATVNADCTLSIVGTNTTSGYTNTIDIKDDAPYNQYIYPAGTYTLPPKMSIRTYGIDGITNLGNKTRTFTVDVPFRIRGIYISFAANETADMTMPLCMVYGVTLPESDFAYSGQIYKAYLSQYYASGKFDWATGNLYDLEGNFIETAKNITPADITGMSGENSMWIGNGSVTVSGTMLADAEEEQDEVIFDPTDYGLPILALNGNCAGMTKDDYVSLDYTFMGMSGKVDVKKQGSSSIQTGVEIGAEFDDDVGGLFNFTLKFPVAFEAKEGWTAQKKYVFKANAIDHSHARNLMSCKLWGEIVKSRANVPAELAGLVNGGAVDGFPIVIVLNGKYYMTGTFNIPKDSWLFTSANYAPKAILCADKHVDATQFKGLANLTDDFELEYVEDEDNADWVLTSLNRAIQAVIDSNGSDLDTTVSQYIDIPSAIDYYIHAVAESATDAVDKNYILVTFDGTKWYFSDYDRDTTYGLRWNGKGFLSPVGGVSYLEFAAKHRLMSLIKTHKASELKARAKELFNGVLSEANVATVFTNFAAEIPAELLAQNCKRWPLLRSTNASNTAQILNWYRLRRMYLDPLTEALA